MLARNDKVRRDTLSCEHRTVAVHPYSNVSSRTDGIFVTFHPQQECVILRSNAEPALSEVEGKNPDGERLADAASILWILF